MTSDHDFEWADRLHESKQKAKRNQVRTLGEFVQAARERAERVEALAPPAAATFLLSLSRMGRGPTTIATAAANINGHRTSSRNDAQSNSETYYNIINQLKSVR